MYAYEYKRSEQRLLFNNEDVYKQGEDTHGMPYSGCGDGKNNISKESSQGEKQTKESICHFGAGPIPAGIYTIEPMEAKHAHIGRNVMFLKPDLDNTMYDRTRFYMHGPNPEHPLQSSDGCIILPFDVRVQIEEKRKKLAKQNLKLYLVVT